MEILNGLTNWLGGALPFATSWWAQLTSNWRLSGIQFKHFLKAANSGWWMLTTCVTSKRIWHTYSKTRSHEFLYQTRANTYRITAKCMRHLCMEYRAARLCILNNSHCSCRKGESPQTLSCNCPGLPRDRSRTPRKQFLGISNLYLYLQVEGTAIFHECYRLAPKIWADWTPIPCSLQSRDGIRALLTGRDFLYYDCW